MFNKVFTKFSKDLGIDLGTNNTSVFVSGKGVVISEPSIVTFNTRTDRVLAVGEEAKKMVGKTPKFIIATKPLVNGIISDFEITEKMLKYFIDRVNKEAFSLLPRPKVVIGIPLDITEVEKKAVEDAVLSAGAREVLLIENPIAAAIGARLPIEEASGNMIIDMGAGRTEIAVVSLGGIVTWKSLTIAGDELNKNITQYAREKFNLLIGEKMAEDIKENIGSLEEVAEIQDFPLRGRDLISGLPKEILINNHQIKEAIDKSIRLIIEEIKGTLETTPPELVADIFQRGIVLTGGGAQLKGLNSLIANTIKIPIKIADEPSSCVIRGIGLVLDDENLAKNVILPSTQEGAFSR